METKGKKKPLSLKNDYVFRSVFGKPEDVEELADFLKSAIGLQEEEYEDISIVDPHLLARREAGKQSVLDIRIRTKEGKSISIELQIEPQHAFKDRIAYYNAKLYTDPLSSGDDYGDLRRAITVVITNFRLIKDENYHHRFRFYDDENRIQLTDAMEICLFELPKLPKRSDGTILWDWLKLIKTEDVKEMEMLAEKNSHIGKTVARVMEMSEDEAERMIAEAEEKWRRDRNAELAYARDEGLAVGEAKGIEEGKAKERFAVARNMKAKGMDVALISELTNLSETEILGL